ncbi:MAG: hypothetical protein AAF215_13245 [Cyanobacteria bacterium P01_A01_bin.123]
MNTRKVTVKSLDPISLGKIQGIILAVIGLIAGVFFALFSVIGGLAADSPIAAIGGGIGAIIFVPVFYGVLGFIGGLLTAVIYNLAASSVGGIEMEFKYTDDVL